MDNYRFPPGTRVVNTKKGTAVPFEGEGTVVVGPSCTYGVSVLWDGCEYFEQYGPDGWTPYWEVSELHKA